LVFYWEIRYKDKMNSLELTEMGVEPIDFMIDVNNWEIKIDIGVIESITFMAFKYIAYKHNISLICK